MDILAGAPLQVQWDQDAKDFTDSPVPGAPVFTMVSLDYFTAQAVLAQESDEEKVRACIAAGLTMIDGQEDLAEQFKANPRATMVNPLFNAIWQHTWGN